MSIKTDLNPKQPTKLEQKVIDIVAEQVPVNTTCPHCERDIDISCLVDSESKWAKSDWLRMAREIIDTVKEHILLALSEEA